LNGLELEALAEVVDRGDGAVAVRACVEAVLAGVVDPLGLRGSLTLATGLPAARFAQGGTLGRWPVVTTPTPRPQRALQRLDPLRELRHEGQRRIALRTSLREVSSQLGDTLRELTNRGERIHGRPNLAPGRSSVKLALHHPELLLRRTEATASI
jgi:hypothetical protein